MSASSDLCPDDEMADLLGALSGRDIDLGTLLDRYPSDPRLHFLQGSLLAGARDYGTARQAMARALELAPDFEIARFQLGFLEFTSGEPERAAASWTALGELADEHPLRLFSEGLMCLTSDDIPGGIALLRRGMAVNEANPPLNRDMQLLIDALSEAQASSEPTSETELLMRQFDHRPR